MDLQPTSIGVIIHLLTSMDIPVGFLRVPGCFTGEGVFLQNLKDSVWKDWGTEQGRLGEITTSPGQNPIIVGMGAVRGKRSGQRVEHVGRSHQ